MLSRDEFHTILAGVRSLRDAHGIVEAYVFPGVPFLFADDPKRYDAMKEAVSDGLGVPTCNVVVVGSAKLGFSTAPGKYPACFGRSSDVDVLIVSDRWFDRSWIEVLSGIRYPRANLSNRVRAALRAHKHDHLLYRGMVNPGGIIPCLSVGPDWFRTFRSLPKITQVRGRSFRGRLFRTWNHARHYYGGGIAQLVGIHSA